MKILFKQEFKHRIQCGIKLHTIRRDQDSKWSPGMVLNMAYESESSKEEIHFNDEFITKIDPIAMRFDDNGVISIKIANQVLSKKDILIFSFQDGFIDFQDFLDWFSPLIKQSKDGIYLAKLIQWTSFDYSKHLKPE